MELNEKIMWFYLDKKELIENNTILTFGMFPERRLDFESAYEGKALEYKSLTGNLPHFLYYDKTLDKVRIPTNDELVNEMSVYTLSPGEYIDSNGHVQFYNIINQKLVGNEVVSKTREEMVAEGFITIETEIANIRIERVKFLEAVDKCTIAHLIGDRILTEEELVVRNKFKEDWLNITNNYTDPTEDLMSRVPVVPDFINYYL